MRWLSAVVFAACYAPDPPFGLPCADNGDCPRGQECDPIDNVCTFPTQERTLRDDTADDFAAGTPFNAVIEPSGAVGPRAYFTGGFRISGIDAYAVTSSAVTYEDLVGMPRTGTKLVRSFDLDFSEPPIGLGIASVTNATVLVDGEIKLDTVGAWQFQLTANENGFIDIAPPGSDAFQRLAFDTQPGTGTIATFDATQPGWYRIRGAFANDGGGMVFRLLYDRPGPSGGLEDIPSDGMRAFVGDLGGLMVDTFDENFDLAFTASLLDGEPLADRTFLANPFGSPIGTTYTLRWSGQFLIDVDGEYAFTIDSEDGHRVWIDGAIVADKLTTNSEISTTAPLALAAGWHDLVVDLNRTGTDPGRLAVTVESGPALVGETFPADHLRPVAGRAGRWFGGLSRTTLAVPDNGSATRTINLSLPAGFTATRAHVAFEVAHAADVAQMRVQLDPPAGATITLAGFGTMTGASEFDVDTIAASSAGTSWRFIASDNLADTLTGGLTFAAVVVIGDGGGSPPFEPTYRYESVVHELPDLAAFGPLSIGLRQGATGGAMLQVRTCDAPAACATAPWVTVANETVPAVERRPFFQYAVDVTTNGDIATAIDFVELRYSSYVR